MMQTHPLFSIDFRSLIAFRIGICLWTFNDLYIRIWNLEAWHTNNGVLDEDYIEHTFIIHRILFYRGPWLYQLCLFIIHFLATCNLLIGYKTTLAAWIHFLFTISIQERMPLTIDGGDVVFRHLTFWLVFLPSWRGHNASIDAIHIQNKFKKDDEKHQHSSAISIRSFASAGVLIQSMIIYPFIMIYRTTGTQFTWYWFKCTAVYNTMARYAHSTDAGQWLAGYPVITFLLCRIAVIIEGIVPMLMLINPFDFIQFLLLFCLLSMQIGFNVFINVPTFGLAMAVSMIPFIPSLIWNLIQKTNMQSIKIQNILRKLAIQLKPAKQFGLLWQKNQQPTLLNQCISLFFLCYIFMSNLGEARYGLNLFDKFDDGNIGELFRLTQQWFMFGPDVDEFVNIDLLIGEIEIIHKKDQSVEVVQIVLHDLLTSDWQKVTVFDDKYKRMKNPTNMNPGSKWSKLIEKAYKREKTRKSLLRWFCRQIEGRELVLRHQDYDNIEYDDGINGSTADIVVFKMKKGIWCKARGEIVCPRVEFADFAKYQCPKYQNEEIVCYHQVMC